MKVVVIVAITKARSGLCIGALGARSGTPYRLLGPQGEFLSTADPKPYSVGELWKVSGTRPRTTPPHVEDFHVRRRTKVGELRSLRRFISAHCDIQSGSLNATFDGALQMTANGSSYISTHNVPAYSTTFWRPSRQLKFDGERYHLDGNRTLKYVGAQAAEVSLKAGTLVRLSLARWWKPDDAPDDFPRRCYLQLSGWY